MTQNLMNDYVRTMKRVRGSDDASRAHPARHRPRARSQRIRPRSRTCAPAAVSARTASASGRTPRRGMRIAAIAACATLLALGGAIALPRLMNRSSPATPVAGMQGFVLAAYADGSAVEGSESTVVTSTDIIMSSGSWSQGEDGSYTTAYTIDPSVLGNDVVSVEYRSTNESVVLEGMRDRGKVLPGESPGTEYLSSITVGGPNATLRTSTSSTCVSPWQQPMRSRKLTRRIGSSRIWHVRRERKRPPLIRKSSAPAPRSSHRERSK